MSNDELIEKVSRAQFDCDQLRLEIERLVEQQKENHGIVLEMKRTLLATKYIIFGAVTIIVIQANGLLETLSILIPH